MQFFAFVAAVPVAAVPAAQAFRGYEGLHCEGEPNLHASCHGCHSFVNSSSFRAFDRVDNFLPPRCITMWTEPGCTGTPYVYPNQAVQCTAVTFPAASFTCENVACSV